MKTNVENNIQNIIKSVKEYGLDRKPVINHVLHFFQINPDDTLQEILRESIDQENLLNINDPNPFRKTTPTIPLPGEIYLGNVQESEVPWMLSSNQLTNKILIIGRSGGGKTNLILLILAQILQGSTND